VVGRRGERSRFQGMEGRIVGQLETQREKEEKGVIRNAVEEVRPGKGLSTTLSQC